MNGKHHVFLAALMTAGLTGGCASSQMNRIDRNREIYETWPIETKQAVLDGKVEVGMTPEMVEVAWGKPTEKIASPSASGDEEIWVWRRGGGDDGSTMMGPMGSPTIGMGGGMGGIGISTGRGGTVLGTSTGIGVGTGIGGMGTGIGGMGTGGIGVGGMGTGITGMGTPIMTAPTPVEEKEVVFRNGVVYRADKP